MLTILIPKEDESVLNEISELCSEGVSVSHSKNFDGLGEIVQAIVAINAVTMPFVYKIIKAQIDSKKYISIKYKGVEITGVNEKKIKEILESIELDSDK